MKYSQVTKKCQVCSNNFNVPFYRRNTAKFCSFKCYWKSLSNNTGKKNPNWLGDKVGYSGIHRWLERKLGKANNYKCKCGKQAEHWTNKNHLYRRTIKDYTTMCISCHRIFDNHPFKKGGHGVNLGKHWSDKVKNKISLSLIKFYKSNPRKQYGNSA